MSRNKKNVKKSLSADSKPVKAKTSKYKSATTGKNYCFECNKGFKRGDKVYVTDVKFDDGTKERYLACSKDHRTAICEKNGFPVK